MVAAIVTVPVENRNAGDDHITGTPTAGAMYTAATGKQFRRVLMPKTKKHVYFEVDEMRGLIIVHAIWGAPRGRGPEL